MSWTKDACDLWAQSRGVPPGGQIGKALKPLVVKYGRRQVLASWQGYLEQQSGKTYCNPFDFAANYLVYRGKYAAVLSEDGEWVPLPDEPEDG